VQVKIEEPMITFLEALETISIVVGLLYTAWSIRSNTRAHQISTLLSLTETHRTIWRELLQSRDLKRIMAHVVNLSQTPLTEKERMFLSFVVLHMHASFRAIRSGMVPKPEFFQKDVADLLSHPIPNAVWKELAPYQNRDFVKFVEEAILTHRSR